MQFILCNRVQVGNIELRAGSIIDDAARDPNELRARGAVLVPMPNPVIEARAVIVRKQEARGRREAELDLLVAAIAEFMSGGTAVESFARTYLHMGG